MSFFRKIFGDPNVKVIAAIRPLVERINVLEPAIKELSDDQLRAKTVEFRERLAKGESIDALLPEAFAAVREASRRTLGQRHFDVQLIGGVVLHRGQIAEMRTGEGKTLTATLAVYLNALTGKGVHVVTVNDYLARRDAVWMGQIYHALGMTVGSIQHETAYQYDPSVKESSPEDVARDTTGAFKIQYAFLKPVPRRAAYQCDITYGTNNEFGFDYLRDNMAGSLEQAVQRELHYAIVDEVDSILIDEARTPLIISAPAEESTDMYYKFADLVRGLAKDSDYNVDEKMHAATFTDAGHDKIARVLGADPWAGSDLKAIHHLEEALKAESLYHLDKQYVVKDNEVIIVDEFTGRLMYGRRYSGGLHQAIEAKERVKIQRESQTMATITFQNLFRLYEKLAGMTGTAATEAEEFSKIYKLDVTAIPTNRDMIRRDTTDKVYKNEKGKYAAVVAEIKARHEKGQPVLVGTISIEKNELLSAMLERAGIPHSILNAKNHEKEAEIIAQAGRRGGVTIATNMAGRGVDIILGGNPPDVVVAEEVRAAGGLCVIGTERHESRRIDNQLRGRAGRQGDPGSSQFFVSLEDDLMRIFASDRVRAIMDRLGLPDDVPIENKMVAKSIEAAQHKVEGHNFDIRKHLLEYDDVLNKHRTAIYRRRREILTTTDLTALRDRILEMIDGEIARVVSFHTSSEAGAEWNIKEIIETLSTLMPLPPNTRDEFEALERADGKIGDVEKRSKMIERLSELARANYDELEKRIANPDLMRAIERALLLRAIDQLWIEHLEAMDHLRTGIGLRGYGQRDPLVEYKRESYRLFQELLALIDNQVVYTIYKVHAAAQTATTTARRNVQLTAPAKEGDARSSVTGPQSASKAQKVGRNDPCPCGSGKKFKKCHGYG